MNVRFALAGLFGLALFAGPAQAVTFTVNHAGSGNDSNTSDGMCSTATPANGTTCTLHAAIQELNGKSGAHTIKFAPAITKITLTASLPTIRAEITVDGTSPNGATGGRVEIDGATFNDCFDLSDGSVTNNPDGATDSTIKNFVLRRCGGNGISASGHGYKILGNRIGTNPAGDSSSSATGSNDGAGISISGTIPVPASLPVGA